jgi:NAD(P)-dependent dehydrogenase (short-subunit alcohol dehydrogenase family)
MSRQIALVTGATAGIGRQAAMEMARRGISVVIAGRDPERGTAVAEDLARASGNNNVAFEQADAASQQSIRELAARVAERHERLDILINNAAGQYVRRTLTADDARGVERERDPHRPARTGTGSSHLSR